MHQQTHTLTGDLGVWRVTLRSGDVVTVHADGVSEEDGYLVFVALMQGTPAYEYQLARIPLTVVADWEGVTGTVRKGQ
jgi:hypothetical protein